MYITFLKIISPKYYFHYLLKTYFMLPYLRLPKTNFVNFTSFFNRNSFTRIRFSLFLFFSFTAVWAQSQTIGTVTRNPNPVCAGSDISISFLVTNGNGMPSEFTTSTTYLVFLSNSSGTNFTQIASFTSGTAPASGNGNTATITESVTIPSGTAFGTGYQISVGSTSPTFDGSTGASASADFTINEAPAVFNVSGGGGYCSGGAGSTITLSGSETGVDYQLNNGTGLVGSPRAGTGSSINFLVKTAATYTIIATNATTGCTSTMSGSATVTINPLPTATYTKTFVSCQGNDGSITLTTTAGTAPFSFSWTGPNSFISTNQDITGLATGDYTVAITDANTCTGTISGITIGTANPLSAGVKSKSNPGDCNATSGSITVFRIGGVNDGITPIQYSLAGPVPVPFQTSNVFTGLSAGDYTATVQDSKGCTGVSPTITLTQAATLAFNPSGSYSINVSSCGGGSDGKIVVSVTGGVRPYHFIIDGVEDAVSNLSTHGFTGLSAGSYTVMVTDNAGCSISKNTTVGTATAPVALINYKGNATCLGGSDGFITVGVTGGIAPYQYSKDGGATFQSSYRFLNLSAGIYDIQVKDAANCPSAVIPVTIADGTVACVGIVASNENSSVSSKWNMGNGILKVQAMPNPTRTEFNLNLQSRSKETAQITVTDMFSKKLYQTTGSANQRYTFGRQFAAGMYIAQVMQGKDIQTIKLIKGN